MDRNQGKAYAALALDLLYKMKIKITPELLAKQIDLTYDAYTIDEVEEAYEQMKKNNKTIIKNTNGKTNCYIVNIFDTSSQQKQAIERFCKNSTLELNKFYITAPGKNSEKFYELIRDIRNKSMEVLIISIFSIYGMDDEEREKIVKLCRKNSINIIEI